jgi:4-diphosphocytidyl-2-C-methyl-D-erythritol kinase
MRLQALAPAKVNLCLFLGGPRRNGRHELVTLLEWVSLADRVALSTLADGPDEVHCPEVPGPNLVSDAVSRLRARGWGAPPVRIEITKRIPVAAGLGGGSADAAAALRLATEVAPLDDHGLIDLAPSLGSDVPGQLVPGVTLVTGAGEVVQPIPPLAPHAWLIVPQPVGQSTAEVYREADRLGLPRRPYDLEAKRRELDAALAARAELPPSLLLNDLQPAAISLRPEIQLALDAARHAGADHALVSGSGPTVVGMFNGRDAFTRAREAAPALSDEYPEACVATPVDKMFAIPRIA